MGTVANCPECGRERVVVEVSAATDEGGTYTGGFWCLNCDAKWVVSKRIRDVGWTKLA
ncbi:hypothetical protein GF325_13360 [Candidatus Bathyarchaeota archaeon]|nr:hypothetical protein [Candidatus Bathyarchaeota archaeon]